MKSLIYKLAYRGADPGRTQPAEESATFSYEQTQRRARLFRRGLLFTLVVIGVAAFVEVVLLPGKLVRARNVAGPVNAAASEAPDESNALNPAILFMSDVERARRASIRRQRTEARLLEIRGRLSVAVQSLQRSLQQSHSQFTATLHLTADHTGVIPAELARMTATDPTAQAAWQNVSALWMDTEQAIAEATTIESPGAVADPDETSLNDREKQMQASIQRIDLLAPRFLGASSDIDHLAIVMKARAALARPLMVQQSLGDLP